jgi:hypothetical protein
VSSDWTTERIRAYLLDELDEAGVSEAEEHLLTDPDFAAEVGAVETDLIDDYVSGRLGDGDRRMVEALLPERPRLCERVAFASALSPRNGPRALSSWRRHAPWLAMVASVTLVTAAAWWAWQGDLRRTRQTTSAGAHTSSPVLQPPAPGAPDVPSPAAPPSPGRQPGGEPAPVLPVSPRVFAVRLPLGVTRGAEPAPVDVPPGTAHVLFRVPLAEGDEFPMYRLTLRNASERVVVQADRLRPALQRELQLTVNANALPARAELHVEGLDERGRATDLAFLPLTVRR